MNNLQLSYTLLIFMESQILGASLAQLNGTLVDHQVDVHKINNNKNIINNNNNNIKNNNNVSLNDQQVDGPRIEASSESFGTPDVLAWMEEIRNDIRRLSDRLDMREDKETLGDGKVKFPMEEKDVGQKKAEKCKKAKSEEKHITMEELVSGKHSPVSYFGFCSLDNQ